MSGKAEKWVVQVRPTNEGGEVHFLGMWCRTGGWQPSGNGLEGARKFSEHLAKVCVYDLASQRPDVEFSAVKVRLQWVEVAA